MSNKITVICLNDKNIPPIIPPHLRIKEGEEYSIKRVLKMGRQKGVFGLVLEGMELPIDCPYDSWDSRRFGVPVDDIDISDALEEEFQKQEKLEYDELS
jgi:hypothetical protein